MKTLLLRGNGSALTLLDLNRLFYGFSLCQICRRLISDTAGLRNRCKAAGLESWEWKVLFALTKLISH